MPKMTKDEARAWLEKLASETGATIEESDIEDLTRRKAEDIEGVRSAFEQQYALRGATGGDRSKGGYSTDLEDDPERVWTRGTEYVPPTKATTTEGDPGQKLIPYQTPEYLSPLSNIPDLRDRIRAYYERFLGRTPSEEEIDRHDMGYTPDWESRLYDAFRLSPEYMDSGEDRIRALYKTYYGDEYEPSEDEIAYALGNPEGIAGIENLLQRAPSEAYKAANPVQRFRPKVEATTIPGSEGTAKVDPSWNRPAPTLGDLLNPEPKEDEGKAVDSPDDDPGRFSFGAQPFSAPPKRPYSASATGMPFGGTPFTASGGMGAPSPWTPTPTASFPQGTGTTPFMGTMGGMMAPPSTVTGNQASWNAYNDPYYRGGFDYQMGPGGQTFNPAPWANVGNQLSQLSPAGTTDSPTKSEFTTDDDALRKAYDFGLREGRTTQENRMLGTQGANDQMNRWIQAWNSWNRPGAQRFGTNRGPGGL
tara:strand:- start:20 stop:1447 length:1428 start_codon:yes stop_codon:yes gene_type:complete